MVVIEVTTNFGRTVDSQTSLFTFPFNIKTITSSKLIVHFTKVNLVQKIQIGEIFLSFARQDFIGESQKKDKIVEELLSTLHVAMLEYGLDASSPSVDKCKVLISSLENHSKKLKEKYEKDKEEDDEKLLQELKGKCESTH